MAHRLEQFEDGDTAFFTNREVAWHALGTVTDGALTADQALETAFLDWTVTKSEKPVSTIVPAYDGDKTETITYGDKFMTYRYHPKSHKAEALGVVGSRYTPLSFCSLNSCFFRCIPAAGLVSPIPRFPLASSVIAWVKLIALPAVPEGAVNQTC